MFLDTPTMRGWPDATVGRLVLQSNHPRLRYPSFRAHLYRRAFANPCQLPRQSGTEFHDQTTEQGTGTIGRRMAGPSARPAVEDGGNQVRIEQIDIKNYRLFKDVTLSGLSQLVVVVGASGTGKSTLFDVFSFLKDALTENVASTVRRRQPAVRTALEHRAALVW